MPYRRLPNTDQSRLRALRTAIQQAERQEFNHQVVSFKTMHEAQNFLNIFEKQMNLYKQTLESQVNANKQYQQILYNVRMYISHFIQVFNFSVIRGDFKRNINYSIISIPTRIMFLIFQLKTTFNFGEKT